MAFATYRADIYTAGTTSYSTSAVEFSLTLTQAPTINGPTIRPFEGRTESRPWTLSALDVNGAFTAQLADAGGRLDLLNRVVQVRRNLNDAGFAVIGGGRLRDVGLGSEVATYDLSIEQETGVDRNVVLFNSTNTTRLYPPSPDKVYGPFQPFPKGVVRCTAYFNPAGYLSTAGLRYYRLTFIGSSQTQIFGGAMPLTDLGLEAIRKDVKALTSVRQSVGNWEHVRLRVGASTYQVVSFGSIQNGTTQGIPPALNPFKWTPDPNVMGTLEDDYTNGKAPTFWVYSPTSAFTVGNSYSSSFLHMFSAPPSEATPLHITNIHPMTLKRQLWNGDYASSDAPRVRYSTAAFNNGSTGLERLPMPLVRFRITEPVLRRTFIEQQLNAPFGVCDFLDSSGKIRPRYVWLPNSTAGFTYTFTAANLRDPHPSWLQPGREMVTQLRVVSPDEQWVIGGLAPVLVANYQRPTNAAADFISATPSTTVRDHDRIAKLGVQPLTLEVNGVHAQLKSPAGFPTDPAADPYLSAMVTNAAKEVFDRYGDGPVMGQLYALSTAESVQEGDLCRITLNTFPNPSIGARGGTRRIQIMGRRLAPEGPEFDYLDCGANLNPLSQPSVTLALSTQDAKHVINATVSALPAGAQFQMDVATSSTLPSSTSVSWQRVQTSAATTGTYPIRGRPAGGTMWARVRAAQNGRIRSAWKNSTAGRASSGLATPVVSVSDLTPRSFIVNRSGGESQYPFRVYVDTSTSASFSTANQLATYPAGTKQVPVNGLASATKYLVGLQHYDSFGGISASDSTTATTPSTSGLLTCRAPVGLYVIFGSSS